MCYCVCSCAHHLRGRETDDFSSSQITASGKSAKQCVVAYPRPHSVVPIGQRDGMGGGERVRGRGCEGVKGRWFGIKCQ